MLHADNLEEGMFKNYNNTRGGKKVVVAAFTDKGKTREINEDNFFISEFDDACGNGYCMIADGMGGHNAGEVASEIAVDVIQNILQKHYHHHLSEGQICDLLKQSMQKANTEIYKKACENPSHTGMGTTAISCLVHHGCLYIAHVGDSRVYRINKSIIRQITIDHSVVEELVNSGTITREEAENHPQKNIITRALGEEYQPKIDIYVRPLKFDDMILICTDGLTNMLSDKEILAQMTSEEVLQEKIERLVNAANNKGGYDNITVVALHYKGGKG